MTECPAGRHGTHTAYKSDGCRCPDAREAVRAYQAEWRKRRYLTRDASAYTPALGSRRRLQALIAIGWSRRLIAAEMGVSIHRVRQLLEKHDVVTRETAARVAAVYDALSMRSGPCDYARASARRFGWPVPLAWDDDEIDDPNTRPRANPRVEVYRFLDEVAIAEAMSGRLVSLTKDERREVVRRLTAKGHNTTVVAERLHIQPDAAQKLVARTRTRDGGWSDLCPAGHDYNDPRVFGQGTGSRYCRACKREKAAA